MRIRPYKRVSRGEPDVCEAVPPGATPAAVVGHDDLARLDQVGPLRRDGLLDSSGISRRSTSCAGRT